MFGGAAFGEVAFAELLDSTPVVITPSDLYTDPKYLDANEGREWCNTRARQWCNTQGGRRWNNER